MTGIYYQFNKIFEKKEMHAPTHLFCLGFRVAKLGNILIQLIKHSFD